MVIVRKVVVERDHSLTAGSNHPAILTEATASRQRTSCAQRDPGEAVHRALGALNFVERIRG